MEIDEVLRKLGQLAYFTAIPAEEAMGGNMTCPPIIVWRYRDATPEQAAFFHDAVMSYRGKIGFEFSSAERTWTLVPSRVREYSRAHGGLGGRAVAHKLMRSDPDFGRAANAELPNLVRHLDEHLQRSRGFLRQAQ